MATLWQHFRTKPKQMRTKRTQTMKPSTSYSPAEPKPCSLSRYHPASLKLNKRGSFSLNSPPVFRRSTRRGRWLHFWTSNKRSDSLRQMKRHSDRNKRNEGQLRNATDSSCYRETASYLAVTFFGNLLATLVPHLRKKHEIRQPFDNTFGF